MKKIEISKELENLLDKANLLTNSCRNDITILEHMDKSSEDFEKSVGYDNICSVKSVLQELEIKLSAEDTGGNKGRSIEFDLQSGIIKVSFLGEEIREI